jgi:hypothetical protein
MRVIDIPRIRVERWIISRGYLKTAEIESLTRPLSADQDTYFPIVSRHPESGQKFATLEGDEVP